MPIRLSVSEVRKEIFRLAAGAGVTGQPSTLLLGRIFHETFASLFGERSGPGYRSILRELHPEEKAWERGLLEHTYKKFIGPRLGREQAHLHDVTEQLMAFWQAVKAMNQWMVNLLWTARTKRKSRKGPDIQLLVNPEEPLTIRLQEPGWTDPVILTGIADLVLRIPGSPHWCIVELKLGRGCPEADLAQACLYHQILASGEGNSSGALALVSFKPQKEEKLFTAESIEQARKKLNPLIGKLAGVIPRETKDRDRDHGISESGGTEPPKREDLAKYDEQGQQLVSIFREYGRVISLEADPIPGPTFIRYPIKLGKGEKLRDVQNTAQEVQHRLQLETPPFIHLSEGSVVVDMQRNDRKIVFFSQIRDQLPGLDRVSGCSRVILGLDLNNRLKFADLSEPDNVHILIAGTAGSGKSEWLRSALAGLLLTNTPETLRLVLIDPKRNAFNELRESSFLMDRDALVYPDEQSALGVLERLADEMDGRYRLLQDAGVDTRDQYVLEPGNVMPRILCMCDEYFDLISRERREREALEKQIFRLGAKARASGIHLMIATQQPNRQTIKGALDANMPARIGLKMSKAIESNMVLNQKGAENLLGSGDLLFKDIGDPVRLQSPFLTPEERIRIFVSSQ